MYLYISKFTQIYNVKYFQLKFINMHICYQLKSQDNEYAAKNMKQFFGIQKNLGDLKEKPTKCRIEVLLPP